MNGDGENEHRSNTLMIIEQAHSHTDTHSQKGKKKDQQKLTEKKCVQ